MDGGGITTINGGYEGLPYFEVCMIVWFEVMNQVYDLVLWSHSCVDLDIKAITLHAIVNLIHYAWPRQTINHEVYDSDWIPLHDCMLVSIAWFTYYL